MTVMRIAILGAGAIGTLLAYRFARVGHAVTVIARGARLEALQRSAGVIRARTHDRVDEVEVEVANSLDPDRELDLLVVAVRRQHADALLAGVARSRARHVMFVFNTAVGLARFRDAVGPERFAWALPAAIATLEADVLVYSIVPRWLRALQITTIGGSDAHRVLFAEAGIPCVLHPDIESWLRTHAAGMTPVIACGILAEPTGALAFRDAVLAARAMRDGFAGVRRAGSRITPATLAGLAHVPSIITAVLLWGAFRFARVRRAVAGDHARGEVEAVLGELQALAGDDLARLRARVMGAPSSSRPGSPPPPIRPE